MTTTSSLILHTDCTTRPLPSRVPCTWPEEEPDVNLSRADATWARSDILLTFLDWPVTGREGRGIVVCMEEKLLLCGRQYPSDKWVPQGLEAGPPWDNRQRNSSTRICPSLRSHQHISSTISPPACFSLPLLLPAVLKLKTAGWNTRLMKPC